jgi:hypothetical protein
MYVIIKNQKLPRCEQYGCKQGNELGGVQDASPRVFQWRAVLIQRA